MLEVHDLSVAYGKHQALAGAALQVAPGEIVVILGANGAGKSTLLKALSGICEGTVTGTVRLGGQSLDGMAADRIVEHGIALVPEGRGIFGELTVEENLRLGAFPERARDDAAMNLERVLTLFPKLAQRRGQIARTMSGGEQQMVAIGRAMMSAPQILMLDEPSLGLSPLLSKDVFQTLRAVRDLGIGILMVEQNARQSLAIADRGYLLENTRIVHEAEAAALRDDPAVQAAYLGGGSATASRPAERDGPQPAPAAQPAAHRVTPAPPRRDRQSADALAGLDLSALVERASDQSRATPQSQPAPMPSATAAGGEIAAMLREFEIAAARAGTRRPLAEPPPAPALPAQSEAPVTIEVYRAPRVEVYRRRPDGGFARDKEDGDA